MAESQSLSILRSLQAENMLQGFGIIKVLKEIRPSMHYKGMPFAECFDAIQNDIAKIGWMKLRPNVDITTASEYLVELATNYERILEGLNRSTMDTQNLLGYCKTIRAKLSTMTTPFHILWSIGAGEMTSDCPGLKKVKDADWKALANMELSAIVEEADQELDAMIEALKITLANLKTMRSTAATTYQVGRDQVNAALSDLEQSDHGFGSGSGMVPQRAGIMALAGLFPGRVQPGQLTIDESQEDDDLPDSAVTVPEPEPTPAPVVLPPELSKTPEPTPAPEVKTTRKKRELPVTVTVVDQPQAPKVEEPKVGEPKAPEPEPTPAPSDPVKLVQADPFISTAQKATILEQIQPPAGDEDDFPGTAAPAQPEVKVQEDDDFPDMGATKSPAPAEESEDDFPTGTTQVVNATPASKELAQDLAPAETPAPVVEPPKPAEVKQPKAIKAAPTAEVKTEEKPRPAGGLFRSRAVPPNMTAAPAFKPSTPVTGGADDLTEFM